MDQYDKVALALQSGDYWVDTQAGEIWSRKYDPVKNRGSDWKLIGKGKDRLGHRIVSLYYTGGSVMTYVHRVVWMVVFGRIPNYLEVDHRDNNTQNNSINNLQLLSSTENNRKKPYGHTRKLTSESVIEMRRIYAAGGVSIRAIAIQFGIKKSTAHAAITEYTWRDMRSSNSL